MFKLQSPVIQEVYNAMHWTNLSPTDSAIGFPNTLSFDRILSQAKRTVTKYMYFSQKLENNDIRFSGFETY